MHTPGPLTVGEPIRGTLHILDSKGGIIGAAYYLTSAEQTANARLWAASPDLLAALETVKAAIHNYLDYNREVDVLESAYLTARAAIAATKGG